MKFKVASHLLEVRNGQVLATTIVTEQKGSWKYQDAFRQAWYEIRYSPRQKKHFFSVVSHSEKFAMNRRNKDAVSDVPRGGLHNLEVGPEVLAAVGTLLDLR